MMLGRDFSKVVTWLVKEMMLAESLSWLSWRVWVLVSYFTKVVLTWVSKVLSYSMEVIVEG